MSEALPGSRKTVALELLGASFAILFQELALIRWLPAHVRVVAYFPNLVLISAFLGMGLGCLRAGRRSLLWLWPVSLAVTVGVAALLSRVVFSNEGQSEHLFLLYYDLPHDAPVVADIRPPLILLFVLSATTFVPLGQVLAERLRRFADLGDPLAGYAWDIGGSIFGIGVFTTLSFAGAFPVAWFSLLLVLGGVYFRGQPRRLAGYATLAAAILAMVAVSERAGVYSPYYALQVRPAPERPGVAVLANGSLHQFALELRRAASLQGTDARIREGYHRPYGVLGRAPRRALVIGAGTGNDVAVLLDQGAEHVDAVEIDPVILATGRLRHPSRPYDSPRVRVFNTDARTYLNNTSERYDVVVFGTLDSMTRLSALSSVRLDNFVYTVECLRSARRLLTPDGGLLMYFMVPGSDIDMRLGGMVTEAFGEVPLVIDDYYHLFNRVYMAGPAFEANDGPARRAQAPPVLTRVLGRTELPSDDWPYLYLQRRGVTSFYASVAAVLMALAVAGLALASSEMRQGLRGHGPDGEMFWLGFGFLLLETASVTEMNLLWGATWLTSAVVFLCVLLTVLAAALVARRRPVRYGVAVVALAVSVLVTYLAPSELSLRAGAGARLAVSLLLVGGPIFFGSLCFSHAYASRRQADRAFGWNVLGAVAGGIFEIASMATGLRALLLVALAAYLGAYWTYRRRAETLAARVA